MNIDTPVDPVEPASANSSRLRLTTLGPVEPVTATDAGASLDDDNVLLRPVNNRQGERGALVGHVVTVKEVWNLLPHASESAADALLTVLTVQRWLTEPRDQQLASDARRTEARRLACGLAHYRCATRRDV
jgi:hypothetical protein